MDTYLNTDHLLPLNSWAARGTGILGNFIVTCKHTHIHSLYKPHELCLNGKTALFLRDELDERKRQLREMGFRVLCYWECKVQERLKTDLDMAEFFDEHEVVGPLFPRDAFQVATLGCGLIYL
jgi:hypothetical protein